MIIHIVTWFQSGGLVMIALAGLGLILGFLLVERFCVIESGLRMVKAHRIPSAMLKEPGPSGDTLHRIALIRACIVIAPLLGLLGTVNGMVHTFHSILAGGYLVEMSQGISLALHTTQYGLAIAAPGLLAERLLIRRMDKLDCLLASAQHPNREPGA